MFKRMVFKCLKLLLVPAAVPSLALYPGRATHALDGLAFWAWRWPRRPLGPGASCQDQCQE